MLPAVSKVFPQVEENILRNIARLQEAEQLYTQAIAQHLKKLVVQKGREMHVPVLKLKNSQPVRTIVWELIKDKKKLKLK